jgi:hypothetical protein
MKTAIQGASSRQLAFDMFDTAADLPVSITLEVKFDRCQLRGRIQQRQRW